MGQVRFSTLPVLIKLLVVFVFLEIYIYIIKIMYLKKSKHLVDALHQSN
jgi:hypothetical protein